MNVTLTTSLGNKCDNPTHSNSYDYNKLYSYKQLYNADISYTMEFLECKDDLVQYRYCNNEKLNSVCTNGQLEKNNCYLLAGGQSARHSCESNANNVKVKVLLLVGLMFLYM